MVNNKIVLLSAGLLLVMFIAGHGSLHAQTYTMSNGSATTCSGTFFDSGGSGGNYSNNENFVFTFAPGTPGEVIQLDFSFFEIENTFDELVIYDGPNTGSPVIGTFSGTAGPGTVISTATGGELTIEFTSDGSINDPGWEAAVSCVPPPPPPETISTTTDTRCSGNIFDTGGAGGNYGNNETITYTIEPATPGEVVEISFLGFDTEANFDELVIHDGPNTGSPVIGTFSGTNSPGTIYSTATGGELTLVFTSDGSITDPEFQFLINCIPPPPPIETISNTTDTRCSGTIFDTGGPTGNYSSSESITYTIEPSTPGEFVELVFTSFETEACCDNLTIHNGPSAASPILGTFAGTASPGTITSGAPGGELTLVFTSDGSVTDPGFEFDINCTPTPGPPPPEVISNTTETRCSGTIFDTGGSSGDYGNSETITYTIEPSTPGEFVELVFTSFETEACCDNLTIHNGPSAASPILGTFAGTTSPGTITSGAPGGELTLVFTSDGSVTDPGFEFDINCTPTPGPPAT